MISVAASAVCKLHWKKAETVQLNSVGIYAYVITANQNFSPFQLLV